MANLKILGAQRVKALTEMLKEQEAAAIAEINKDKIPHEHAELLAFEELGIRKEIEEINEIKHRLSELSATIRRESGIYFSLNRSSNYGPERTTFDTRTREIQNGDTQKRVAEVKAEFKRREQRLWLCETLEEAKAIVGIE